MLGFDRQRQIYLSANILCSIILLGLTASCLMLFYDYTHRDFQLSNSALIDLALVLSGIAGLLTILFLILQRASFTVAKAVQDTIDSLVNGVAHFDEQGQLLSANPVAQFLIPELAATDKNGLGTYKNFLTYVYDHSLDINDQNRLSLDLVATEEFTNLLFQEIIRKDNDKIILMQFYQHKLRGIIVLMTDISMMKKSVDKLEILADENSILAKTIEALSNGVFILSLEDNKETMLFANKTFCDLMGITSGSLSKYALFPAFADKFPELEASVIRTQIEQVEKTGRPENIWLKGFDENKMPLWYLLQVYPVPERSGKRLVVGFLSDQTQTRLKEAQLYQSQKLEAIGQLAGGIAHDFNNILSIIDGYSKLAENGSKRKEDITSSLQHIRKAIKRGSGLTSKLLTFGHHQAPQNKKVNIVEHIHDLEGFLNPLLENATLAMSLEDVPLYVECAPDTITQIVMNLTINSRDAMPDGGNIIIAVHEAQPSLLAAIGDAPKGRYACIQVIDGGTGIPQDIMPKIFNPFFTTKDQGKGTGLGLSLVYGLIRQMGGFIDVKSAVNSGTTMAVFLPICDAPEDDCFAEPALVVSKKALDGKVVLVAEDEPDLLQLMVLFLEDFGMKVLSASDGNEALAVQDEFDGKIDYLVTDVVMPGLNGARLAELMAEIRPETEIIFMSGYPTRGDMAPVTLPEGANFLQKPIDENDLEAILGRVATGMDLRMADANNGSTRMVI